jgi:SAM-dependent methyltransferase
VRRVADVYVGPVADSYEAERMADPMWQMEQDTIGPVLFRVLRRGDRVLDVAAGTGRWIDLYAAAGVKPVLLDVSPDMLRIAAGHARSQSSEVEFVEGNALEMPSLPGCDWCISTRFFNWIPLAAIETVVRAASSAGAARLAFTARYLDLTADLSRRTESLEHWQKKNLDVIRGSRKKGIYHLHSSEALRDLLARLDARLDEEHVIERARGDIYSLFLVSLGARHRPVLGEPHT